MAKSNSKPNRNKFGEAVDYTSKLVDRLTVDRSNDGPPVDRCYQFGESAISSIVGRNCSTSVMDSLESLLMNNSIAKFLNKGLKTANNAIDSVKSFGSKAVGAVTNSSAFKSVKSFYCGTLAPAMKILLMVLESLIAIPLTILRGIYKFLQKIRDVATSLVNKLFDCMGGFLDGLEDSIGTFDLKVDFKLNDLLSFFDDLSEFLKNCEVISRPLLETFNAFIDPCSDKTLRPLFNAIGMTSDDVEEPILCSAEDLRKFLDRRKNIINIDPEIINKLISSINPISGIFKGARILTNMARTYSAYGISAVHDAMVRPFHKLEAMYNNFLSTRSRFLGILVNSLLGWLLPDCGSSKFDEGIIRRRKYSINDVIAILDSMSNCNSYMCGGINNQVQTMLASLELSKWGKWVNPLVKANETVSKYIDSMYLNSFGSASDQAKAAIGEYNVDSVFIKSLRAYSLNLAVVA